MRGNRKRFGLIGSRRAIKTRNGDIYPRREGKCPRQPGAASVAPILRFMIAAIILASTLTMRRPAPVSVRLASIQAQIDRTMGAEEVTRLNAEYARLQRELDERDMAWLKVNTTKLNDFLEER